MKNKLILVRHAAYRGEDKDPEISDFGKKQATLLAGKLIAELCGEKPILLSSTALRAVGTAEIIARVHGVMPIHYPELWSDNYHNHDFTWLNHKLYELDSKNCPIIVVSHLEYVQDFPKFLGYRKNDAGYAQGVVIFNNKVTEI